MLERTDIQKFTADKQELQIVTEMLFEEMMQDFNLTAFLADPRAYTRAFLANSAGQALRAVLGDAQKLGEALADKAASQ